MTMHKVATSPRARARGNARRHGSQGVWKMTSDTTRLSRRSALRLLMVATGATLAAACGPQVGQAPAAPPAAPPAAAASTPASAPPSATVTAAGAPAAQPKPGGTLRIGAVGDVANLDGHSWGPKNGFSIFMIFDTLTNYDANLKPQPMLAESWDFSSDFKQLKLQLRKNVQFHTGREMTGADIVYNLQRPLDPKLQATIPSFTILPGFVPPNTVFEAPDKYTVTIKTEQPWPAIFDYFQVLNIMDKETAEGPDSKTKAVGTGPFAFAEWAQGQYLRFEKHKNYWQSGRPYLDGVRVNIKADAVAMTTELEAGASDIVLAPSWRDFARLKASPNFQAIKVPVPGHVPPVPAERHLQATRQQAGAPGFEFCPRSSTHGRQHLRRRDDARIPALAAQFARLRGQ